MKYRLKTSIWLLGLALWLPLVSFSQVTVEDYDDAEATREYNDQVYRCRISPNWISDTHHFWYEVQTRKGGEYFLVDAEDTKKQQAFDQNELARVLKDSTGEDIEPYDLPLRRLEFDKNLKTVSFLAEGAEWQFNRLDHSLEKVRELDDERDRDRDHWGEGRDYLGNEPEISPDSNWVAYIKDYDVWVKNRHTDEEHQLSFDGSEGELYSSYIRWAPDSKKLATYKVRPNKDRYIYFVESSPDDQLQPEMHKLRYLKPGDALPIKRPALFHIDGFKEIPVNGDPFEHQYSTSRIEWWEDSRGYTFEFNERGHQLYQVVEVDAQTGDTRVLIEEKSETFVNYSHRAKLIRHDINDGEEIIWTSERDGWNHLYLFDGHTGEIKNQITRGEWVVRGIEDVNEEQRRIIFQASGKKDGEDPYSVHYYQVNFDGSDLKELTPEQAHHRASFSEDHQYFVDVYSRPDQAPKTVLRETATGKKLMDLEDGDISDLLDEGWTMPEVFTAKGRDGKTDIWGNIYRPSNFDASKTYPIIEAIYAGPHGSHVSKSFRAYRGEISRLNEMGFIVVRIDGMGTNNRSKEFLDVCWQDLKDAGFPDRIRWMKAAAEEYPYMDTSRVGIYGTSAGGQNAMGALLFHPEFYKTAVASCGCHDNRMDKMWWNEQWMGYPIGPHYAASSNVVNAHKLEGDLMLLVGEIDNNVDPASTFQVADALIEADKEFELVVMPGYRHTSGGDYGARKRMDFFIEHLMGEETPKWNQQ
mgnify:CR=1 FL=1